MEVYVIAIVFIVCASIQPATYNSEWHDYLKEII